VIFYCGAQELIWLERLNVPLFMSRNRSMRMAHKFPRARVPWAFDSGGYCEITNYGGWRSCARDFARDAEFFQREIGAMQWAAPQDWPCEAKAVGKSRRSILEHQQLTVDNFIELRSLPSTVPWVPVLQGWSVAEYLRHMDMYAARGIDLSNEPLVGVGSVCKRTNPREAFAVLDAVARAGFAGRIHAFGLEGRALAMSCHLLASADSFAWSRRARWAAAPGRGGKPGEGGKPSDRNDPTYALEWRHKLLETMPPGCNQQHPMLLGAEYADLLRQAAEGRRQLGHAGQIWGRDLFHLVADASMVAYANALLEEEELLGLPRGTFFLRHNIWDLIPPTRRAFLPPETVQRLVGLRQAEWERIGDSKGRVMAALALSLDPHEPVVAPDPAAAQQGLDWIFGHLEEFSARHAATGWRGAGVLGWRPTSW